VLAAVQGERTSSGRRRMRVIEERAAETPGLLTGALVTTP
jgi:hypothetical protein